MLIKVKPNIYLNTDHLIAVQFYKDVSDIPDHLFNWRAPGLATHGPCALLLTSNSRYSYQVTESAAQGLLHFLDANESIVFDGDLQAPAPDLKSQIAVSLRDTWKGATLEQLECVFNCGIPALKSALAELEVERVVTKIGNLFYHASSSEAQTYKRNLNAMHFSAAPSDVTLCGFVANGITTTATLALVNCSRCREELGFNIKPSPDLLTEGEALPDAFDPVVECNDLIAVPKIES